MTYLLVDVVPMPAATLVTIGGEVDFATVAQFRASVEAAPDRDTVVEMSNVTLLAAAGLRVLLDLQDRLAAVGAPLVLAAVSRPVHRVLTVTGLDARLPMASTVDDALTALEWGTWTQQMPASEQWRAPAEPVRGPGPVARGGQRDSASWTPAAATADQPVRHTDDQWSQDADQRSASMVRDAVSATSAARLGLIQEQAGILRAGAVAVRQASTELTAHAAVLRLQASTTLARADACRRRGGSSQPSANACDVIGDEKQAADAVAQREQPSAGPVAALPAGSVRAG